MLHAMKSRQATLILPRIGCAGWSVMARHADLFAPADSMLARYATRFNAVEINSSFYRPHQLKTYQRWAESVPSTFRFSVKMPKTITHEKALLGCAPELDRFLGEVAGLGNRLGGILVQLPPSQVFDARRANSFFAVVRRRTAAPIACEPRHSSWFGAAADTVWERYSISRVAADPAPIPGSGSPGGHGPWAYHRLHGSPRMYYSQYGPEQLHALALSARQSLARGLAPWVIFDNTAHGFSTTDAVALQALLAP